MRRTQIWKTSIAAVFLISVTMMVNRNTTIWSCPKINPSNQCVQMSSPSNSHGHRMLSNQSTIQNSNGPQELATHPQENHTFAVKKDALDPLTISYKYLLGSRPVTKRYLAIGISSLKRTKENYLTKTIQSIFRQSSNEELEELLLVVYLANREGAVNGGTALEIEEMFYSDVAAGRLIVVSSSLESYPPLQGLKRNFNDSPERVSYRSKQNVDYAFLVNFCAGLSQFYLMLEDDVVCARNFVTSIKNNVNNRDSLWTTITFSTLGYIGKLYHNADLPKLARFLLLFYDEMPCDWLLDHFFRSKAQKEIIRIKPSLFQHIGTFSSFQSNNNKLKDADFVEFAEKFGDSPSASCYTNIAVHEQNGLMNVCNSTAGYFWGTGIREGSYVTMVFHNSVNIDKIHIVTGASEHPNDFLKSGYLEMGREKTEEHGRENCKVFTKIGDFLNGTLEVRNLGKAAGEKIDCLRIQVTASQSEWLIITKVGIWVRKD
ncbi:hypothetical protein FKM82_003246 [Ascaphus truei]